MDREIRISPDGMMTAIRSDYAADAWNAWMVAHCMHGGHWSSTAELVGWSVVTAIETPPPVEPPPANQETPGIPPGAETP